MQCLVWRSMSTWYTWRLLLSLPTSARALRRQRPVPRYPEAAESRGVRKEPVMARQGSTRAPQWTGGGVVFAPTPRDYTIRLNKKEKRAALKSALTSRVQENKFIVVDELKLDEIKTKKFKNVLDNLKVNQALVVVGADSDNVVLLPEIFPL